MVNSSSVLGLGMESSMVESSVMESLRMES